MTQRDVAVGRSNALTAVLRFASRFSDWVQFRRSSAALPFDCRCWAVLLAVVSMISASPAAALGRNLQELVDGGVIVVPTLEDDLIFDQFTATVDPSSKPIDFSKVRVIPYGEGTNYGGIDFRPDLSRGEDPFVVAGSESVLLFVRYNVRTANGSSRIVQAELDSFASAGRGVGSDAARLQLDVTEELFVVSGKGINRVSGNLDVPPGPPIPETSISIIGNDTTGEFDPVSSLQVETRISFAVPGGHGHIANVGEIFYLRTGMEPDCPPTDALIQDAPFPIRICFLRGGQFPYPFVNFPINLSGDGSGLLTSAPPLTEQTEIFWSGFSPQDDLPTVGTVNFVTNPSLNFSFGDGGVSGVDTNGDGLLSYEQSVFDENSNPVGLNMTVQNLDANVRVTFLSLGQTITHDAVDYDVDRLFGQFIAGGKAFVNAELIESGGSGPQPAILILDISQIFVDGSVQLLDAIFAGSDIETNEGPVPLADRGLEVTAVDNESGNYLFGDISLDAEFREFERLFFVPGDGGLPRLLALRGDDADGGNVIQSLLV